MQQQTTQLILSNDQFWVLAIGSIVPLGTYVFNRFAPWNNEQIKAIVQVVLTAVAGVAYTAIAGGVNGFGDYSQQAFTAILAGLFAHNVLWKPSGMNIKFGANAPAAEQR